MSSVPEILSGRSGVTWRLAQVGVLSGRSQRRIKGQRSYGTRRGGGEVSSAGGALATAVFNRNVTQEEGRLMTVRCAWDPRIAARCRWGGVDVTRDFGGGWSDSVGCHPEP